MDVSRHNRVILNQRLAADIYAHKLSLINPTTFDSLFKDSQMKTKGQSSKVAVKYGVSPKTVRDIWNRRTWTNATRNLWEPEFKMIEVSWLNRSNNIL